MKKIKLVLIALVAGIGFYSCGEDCDPGGNLPQSESIILLLRNSNNTAFLHYPGSILPDSVTVINLANNQSVQRTLRFDSILYIDDYNKTDGAVTRFKIQKGTVLKPDTLEVTAKKVIVNDACNRPTTVFKFASLKVNNTVICTNCPENTAAIFLRK